MIYRAFVSILFAFALLLGVSYQTSFAQGENKTRLGDGAAVVDPSVGDKCSMLGPVLDMFRKSPVYAREIKLEGVAAQPAIALFNSTEPATNLTFERVIVIEGTNGDVMILYINKDRQCASLGLPADKWQLLRFAIIGRDA
jgi:hypothetical protein